MIQIFLKAKHCLTWVKRTYIMQILLALSYTGRNVSRYTILTNRLAVQTAFSNSIYYMVYYSQVVVPAIPLFFFQLLNFIENVNNSKNIFCFVCTFYKINRRISLFQPENSFTHNSQSRFLIYYYRPKGCRTQLHPIAKFQRRNRYMSNFGNINTHMYIHMYLHDGIIHFIAFINISLNHAFRPNYTMTK